MILRDATPTDIAHVLTHMRAADRREVFACRFDDSDADLIDGMVAAAPRLIVLMAFCGDDGMPIALMGAGLGAPGLADVIMVATDAWPTIAFAATRLMLRSGMRDVFDLGGIRRTECKCWTGHTAARRWLQVLGFVEEGVLRAYGKGGEDFVQCARLGPPAIGRRKRAGSAGS